MMMQLVKEAKHLANNVVKELILIAHEDLKARAVFAEAPYLLSRALTF